MGKWSLPLLFTALVGCVASPTDQIDLGQSEVTHLDVTRRPGVAPEVTADDVPIIRGTIRTKLPLGWSVQCEDLPDGTPSKYLADEIRETIRASLSRWPGLFQESPCGTFHEDSGPFDGIGILARFAPGTGATFYTSDTGAGVRSWIELRGDWFFQYEATTRARIVTHELMHLVGLNHIADPSCVMNPTTGLGEPVMCAQEVRLLNELYGGR